MAFHHADMYFAEDADAANRDWTTFEFFWHSFEVRVSQE